MEDRWHETMNEFSDERELDDCQLDETTRATLLNEIRLRLAATTVKYRAGRSILLPIFTDQSSFRCGSDLLRL